MALNCYNLVEYAKLFMVNRYLLIKIMILAVI